MTIETASTLDRRTFLVAGTLGLAGLSGLPRAVRAHHLGPNPVQEPWGTLEPLGDGLWALISAPLADRTTLCNGGIVAGRDRVLIVEAFATPRGASWMVDQARRLTGRDPTHVLLTHFHGDHTGGLSGYGPVHPEILVTATTRNLVARGDRDGENTDATRVRLLESATIVSEEEPTELDLGNRLVRLAPRAGHTPSDLTLEIPDEHVIWCGDLVWNGMFPNYRDAIPSVLSRDVRALTREAPTRYVPGHGTLADAGDLARFLEVIDDVGQAARRAFSAGTSMATAAADYRVPERLGEWMLFSPRYFEVAFRAWERVLTPR